MSKIDATQLGPRQAKAVQEAINKFNWEAKTFTELHGTHGKPETERRSVVTSPFRAPRADAAGILDAVLFTHEYKATPATYAALIADIQKATAQLAETRPVQDHRITQDEHQTREQRNAEADRQRQEYRNAAAESWAVLERKRPASAQALVVAELEEDKSELQSDYHGSVTVRRVAIGWRTGSREDFRQLRAASATFPATAHLGPGKGYYAVRAVWVGDSQHYEGQHAPCGYELEGKVFHERAEAEAAISEASAREEMVLSFQGTNGLESGRVEYRIAERDIEHRDNYSMGHGNWLGINQHSGWQVRSYDLKYTGYRDYIIEDAIPEATSTPKPTATTTAAPVAVNGVTISENDEKDGLEIRFPSKPDTAVLERLKANGWRWSRFASCWYHKRTEQARAFAESLTAQTAAA